MPQIHEEIVLVKFCKLTKNESSPPTLVTGDILDALSSVAEELANDSSIVVEVEKA